MKKEYDYLLVGAGLFNAVFAFMARQHGKLLSFSRFYLFVMVLIFLSSCDNRLNKALNEAENNQEELEKVLDYFKNDPETLKYSAARFLIENMPGHYSYSGAGIKQYESAYANMAHEAIQNKDSVFSIYWNQTDRDNISMSLDIKSIKADYLIAMINEACDMWRSSSWSKYYDINYF